MQIPTAVSTIRNNIIQITRSTWQRRPRLPKWAARPARAAGVALLFYLGLKAAAWLIPLPEHALFRPSSTLVFDRSGGLLQAFISDDDMWRIETPLSGISPHLRRAVLGFEDRWFYWHPGINPMALGRAFFQNARAGRVISGGSTMTMQIARMMEPKSRTLKSKFIEVLRAFQLELRYSKAELLQIYFNIAPYGGNIEGVAAAAWLYFGKEPSGLSLGEAALLAAIPNSPSLHRPDISPAGARAARRRVLERLLKQGVISRPDCQAALHEEIPGGRQNLPRTAPHFCRDLRRDYPGEARLYSTLDRRIQETAEDLLRLHLTRLRPEGITNGAIVVIDNRNHDILAMVGSGDFDNRRHSGQVNGALAPRSPGSALKPFIYALAMQKGMISPARYLEDVPSDFSGYAPENFDRTFSGVVSARVALERSLNVPAVSLEAALGEDDLYALMERVDVDALRARDNYGLSIAIGGCEVSLLDLTSLYSALGCSGEYVRPRWLLSGQASAPVRIVDEGAAYLITDILTGLRRPDLPACWEFTTLPRVAWKTGTSYGHRDAWCIGYNPRYTIGVWIGNFSGAGAPGLVGAEVATPILFELMNSVCRGQQIPWFIQPESVSLRDVCNLSGQPPGPHCPAVVEEMYLPDRSPDAPCEFHVAADIDNATGFRIPSHLVGTRKSHLQVFVQWPARVGTWLESTGQKVDRLPPLLPGWQGVMPGAPPIIRSPSQNCQYRLREGVPPEYQKICFEASVGGDVRQVFWFVDGRLLGTVRPGERLFYTPVPGKHRVVCQDDSGRSTEFLLVIEGSE